jgi:hypothetical protein
VLRNPLARGRALGAEAAAQLPPQQNSWEEFRDGARPLRGARRTAGFSAPGARQVLADFQSRVLRTLQQQDGGAAGGATLRDALQADAVPSSSSTPSSSPSSSSSAGRAASPPECSDNEEPSGSAGREPARRNGAAPEAGSSHAAGVEKHQAGGSNGRHAADGGGEHALNGASARAQNGAVLDHDGEGGQGMQQAMLGRRRLRELKALCEERGLPQYGKKEVLVQRLLAHNAAAQADASSAAAAR